ncbi:MAG: glutamate--tRNA ligase [Euryarchaeota archaeon]|jgi:glutamyl-tRNA synthetase|nr:glutamate--tRNA ligase [Euryarchaeota archaeon]
MSEWVPDEATTRLIRKYAMQNALEYDGKGQAGSVQGRILGEVEALRPHAKYLFGILGPAVEEANLLWHTEGAEAVKSVLESEAPEALEKRVKERRIGLPELPNAVDGEVVLRFAPNPNGPLTLGHSRGVIINSQYAEMYNGKMILRFDDTDTKIKRPDLKAYDWIIQDFTWLSGKEPDLILEASARMPEYLTHANEFIAANHMYVCTCTAEDFRELRVAKSECPCRANTAEKNSELWRQMNDSDGSLVEGDAVVRVRTGMDNKNPALRDWPAWRIQRAPHPKVGEKYRVWPLLDFQSAVEDHLQGVTHIIRGKDLMDSTRKQKLLYDMVGWKYPETLYWGRVKVHEFGGFSTSQMKKDIQSGQFSGWDDPRLPTISALRRRGYDAGAMTKFWIDMGLTQKDISVPMSTLNSLNAKAVNAEAPRLTFVREPVSIRLDLGDGFESPAKVTLPIHPEHLDKGVREWPLGEGVIKVKIAKEDFTSREERRLKDFADIGIKHQKTIHGWESEIIRTERVGNTPIIHWLPSNMAKPAVLLLEEEGELIAAEGLLEINDYPVGTVVQLERMGFARIESNEIMIWTHS